MMSTVYIRPLLALLVLAAIVAIVAAVLRDGSHAPVPGQSANRQLPDHIDVSLKKARFSEIQAGLVAWELVAERVDYDKSGDTAYLSGIQMEFPRTRSRGAVTVTADSGRYVSTEKTVHLAGHVHVVTEDGASFKTDSIVYTGTADQFSTSNPVTFRQQRLQLTAIGMVLGVKSQQAHFNSSVDATVISQ